MTIPAPLSTQSFMILTVGYIIKVIMLIAEKQEIQDPCISPHKKLHPLKQSTNDSPTPSTAEPNHLPP